MRKQPAVADFEDKRSGSQSKECRQPLEAGKGEGADSSLKAPKGTSPAKTFILAKGDHCPISDLQNCNVMNLC